nr:hypothetical protein [uncultured Cohaesibacter sp.]
MSDTPASNPGAIERTVVHIVRTTTVAGIIGGYVAVSDLKTSNAVLESQISALTVRIDDLKSLSVFEAMKLEIEKAYDEVDGAIKIC